MEQLLVKLTKPIDEYYEKPNSTRHAEEPVERDASIHWVGDSHPAFD